MGLWQQYKDAFNASLALFSLSNLSVFFKVLEISQVVDLNTSEYRDTKILYMLYPPQICKGPLDSG